MDNNSSQFIKDAFASPLGEFIASIGKGVGEAQAALDAGSLRQTLEIYNEDPENKDEMLQLFRDIGYQPTFYVLPKTTAKAKISLTMSQKNVSTLTSNKAAFVPSMYITPMNATTTNTYNLDLNASAELQFEIVPIPPTEMSMIRMMPNLHEPDNQAKYLPLKQISNTLDSYGINYEFNLEDVNLENDTVKNIELKDSNKTLEE